MNRHWPFAVILVVQLVVLAVVPIRQVRARYVGTDVTLAVHHAWINRTAAGFEVRFTYVVEQTEQVKLSGTVDRKRPAWLTLGRGEPVWTAVDVTQDRPPPAKDRVAVPCTWGGSFAQIDGPHELAIPEVSEPRVRTLLNRAANQAVVDLRITEGGSIALMRLRVGGESFGD